MSELKAGIIYADFNRNLFIYHGAEEKDSVLEDDEEVYKKSEADKVIAEKDKEIDLYKRGWEESDRINAVIHAELRHQKYKRCLNNAWWCEEAYNRECGLDPEEMTNKEFYKQQTEFWYRWNSKWLKLAEQFKEAK